MIKSSLYSVIVVLALGPNAFAQKPIYVDTKVEKVKVHLDGAEITREKVVNVAKGENVIIFKNASTKLIDKSLQVAAENLDILSVSTETNYLNIEKKIPKIKVLKDSLEYYESNSIRLQNQINSLKEEWNFILANNSYVKEGSNSSITGLKEGSAYVRKRNFEINEEMSKLTKERNAVNTKLNAIQLQLRELNGNNNPERTDIIIKARSSKQIAANISVRYIVSHASWEPNYDIVVEDIHKPIRLKYKAKVYNNTDIPWDDVDLTLSTADPTRGASRPYLSAWELNYKYAQGHYRTGNDKFEQKAAPQQAGVMGNTLQEDQALGPNIVVKTVALSELSSEFEIENKYSIPSDAKAYIVDVVEHTLDASYEHLSIPKLEHAVFLLAKITGWERLNLVDGNASIYFAGNYIGESEINTALVGDSLDISLGRDSKIQINRKKLVDLGKKQSLGNNRKVSFSYEILVKNNRNTDVNVEIQDQLPVAKEADIIVTAEELSGAHQNEHDGTLTWNVPLKPDESKKIALSFSIKFPKNKDIDIEKIRKYRTIKWL